MARLYVTFVYQQGPLSQHGDGFCDFPLVPTGGKDPMLSFPELSHIRDTMLAQIRVAIPAAERLVVTNWTWLRPDPSDPEPPRGGDAAAGDRL